MVAPGVCSPGSIALIGYRTLSLLFVSLDEIGSKRRSLPAAATVQPRRDATRRADRLQCVSVSHITCRSVAQPGE